MTNSVMKRSLNEELKSLGLKKNVQVVGEQPVTFRTIIQLIETPGAKEVEFWLNRFPESKFGTYIMGTTVYL